MTINLNLNTEQENALASLLTKFNSDKETPLSEEQYLETVLLGIVNGEAKRLFDESAKNLVDLARNASYEKRLALTNLVASQLS